MNDCILREGFDTYYVVKQEGEYPYEQTILENKTCKGLLPFSIRRVDGEIYYYFKTSGYDPLDQKLKREKMDLEFYERIYQQILEAVEELEEFLLPIEGLLLDSFSIFYHESEHRIFFCYLPGKEGNLIEEIQGITEEFFEWIDYENRPLVEYLYGLHEDLCKGKLPDFVISKIAEEETEEDIDGILEWRDEDAEEFFVPQKESRISFSKKWYGEVLIGSLVSMVTLFVLVYTGMSLWQDGINATKIKILFFFAIAFFFNGIYLIQKVGRRKSVESYTTVLTEKGSIDKIG